MVSEVPTDVAQTDFVAKRRSIIGTVVGRIVCEVWNRLSNGLKPLQCPLLDVLGIKFRNLKFLLTCKVHHEDVERISTGQFSFLHLQGYHSDQVIEVFVIVIPVTTIQFGVHKGHQSVGLIHIELQRLFVVLESLVEFAFEFEHIT